MGSPYYPDGLPSHAYCIMEGCVGKGYCRRCGETNYALMGYYGAVARWAKKWGVSEDEAERRIEENQEKAFWASKEGKAILAADEAIMTA